MALPVVSWRVGADNVLELVGLTNTLDDSHPEDATVTVTVRNRAGVVVTGLNAAPAAHVPGTTGVDVAYRLYVDDAVTPIKGIYKAEAVATRSGVTGREFAIITVEED